MAKHVFVFEDPETDERHALIAGYEAVARFGLGGRWNQTGNSTRCQQFEMSELPRLIKEALNLEMTAHTAMNDATRTAPIDVSSFQRKYEQLKAYRRELEVIQLAFKTRLQSWEARIYDAKGKSEIVSVIGELPEEARDLLRHALLAGGKDPQTHQEGHEFSGDPGQLIGTLAGNRDCALRLLEEAILMATRP